MGAFNCELLPHEYLVVVDQACLALLSLCQLPTFAADALIESCLGSVFSLFIELRCSTFELDGEDDHLK